MEDEPNNIRSKDWWNSPRANGWEVLHAEQWKKDVVQLHMRHIAGRPEFRIVYCRNENLPDYVLARYWRLRWPRLGEFIDGALAFGFDLARAFGVKTRR